MFNPSEIPSWVSGGSTNDGSSRKYHRAVKFFQTKNAELKAQGQPSIEITEEAVKELYERWGGLVLEDYGAVYSQALPEIALGRPKPMRTRKSVE